MDHRRNDCMTQKVKGNNNILIIILLFTFLLAGFAGGYYFFYEAEEPAEETADKPDEEAIPVTAERSALRSLTEYTTFNAAVTPESTYYVFPPMSEEVETIHVKQGERVTENQLLFTLDQSIAQIEKREVEAGIKSAQSQLDEMRRGARSQEIREAESHVKQAESALKAARESYELLKEEREDLISERQQVIEAENQVNNARIQRDMAANQIEEAEIGLEEIKTNFERMKNLYEQGALPERDFEEIEYQKERIEQQLKNAELQYEQAEANLDTAREGLKLARQVYEEPRSLELQLIEAENQIEVSEANLEAATAMLDLIEEGPSQEELARAEAQLEQAEAARDIVQERIEMLQVKSPAAGIVSQLEIEEGTMVSPEAQSPPVVLISPTLQLELTVNEDVLVNLDTGRVVETNIPAVDEQIIEGQITYIGAAFDRERGGFPLEIELDLPGARYRAGMYASVQLPETEVENVVTVPRSAVLQEGINNYVYTIDDNNRVVENRVQLGAYTEQYYEITDGLQEDERVITRGQDRAAEGDLVEVRNNEDY